MQKYKVTTSNQSAITGMIRKFLESCNHKGDDIIMGESLVTKYMNADGTIGRGRVIRMNTHAVAYEAIPVQPGDTVLMFGGNRILIHRKNNPSVEFIRNIARRLCFNQLQIFMDKFADDCIALDFPDIRRHTSRMVVDDKRMPQVSDDFCGAITGNPADNTISQHNMEV